MAHRFALFISLVFLTGCASDIQYSAEKQQPGTATAPTIISANTRLATGFFVTANGHFVTNYHVVSGADEIFITDHKGKRVPAKVLVEDRDMDIVIAKANISSHPMPIGNHTIVEKGDEVLTLGYPLFVIQGKEQKATFGRINAFSGIRGDPHVYQIDVPLQPGNSGGPLISEHGVVIGMVKATFNQMTALKTIGTLTQNVNFAIKSDHMLPLLRKVLGSKVKESRGTKNQQEMSALIQQFEHSVVLVETK